MKNFLINFLDWIYKKRCYCCSSSRESVSFCSKCYLELDFNPPQPDRIILGTNIYVAGSYNKNLQKIIRGLKYHNKKELAYFLAKFIYEYWGTLNISKEFQVIPVPLHEKRQRQRRYNHMELVAEEFCKMSGFSLNNKLIKRVKDTKPQYKLSRAERMQNLDDAFDIDFPTFQGSPVLLIDDICTSGATFESIIEALHKKGINDVVCLAVGSPCS